MLINATCDLLRRRCLTAIGAITFMVLPVNASAQNTVQDVTGLWRVMDGAEPDPVSIIAVSEQDGVVSGTVMRVMHSTQGEHPVCHACKGPLKDKPIVGLTILWNLKRDGNKQVWTGGSVLDPSIGQTYRCKLTLKDADTLEVRGYLGISLLGRSQTWKRAQPIELTAPLPARAPSDPGSPAKSP